MNFKTENMKMKKKRVYSVSPARIYIDFIMNHIQFLLSVFYKVVKHTHINATGSQ